MKKTLSLLLLIPMMSSTVTSGTLQQERTMIKQTIDTSASRSNAGQWILTSSLHEPIVQPETATTDGQFTLASGFLTNPRELYPKVMDIWVIR